MAQQDINHGTIPGDGTGEIIFDSFDKCQANFDELYAYQGRLPLLTDGDGASLIGIHDTTLYLYSGDTVQAALEELGARANGIRKTIQNITTASTTLQVTQLDLQVRMVASVTHSTAAFFDFTNLPGGIHSGDRLRVYMSTAGGPFKLTLDSTVTTQVYLWGDVTGDTTFTFEPWQLYEFIYDGSTWTLDWRHIVDKKTADAEAAIAVLQAGGTSSGTLGEAISIPYQFTSQTRQLPTNSGYVRLDALTDCFISFGDEEVSASGTTSLYMAAGVESLGIPPGATHIAVKGAGNSGALSVTGLDAGGGLRLTTNVVLPVTAATDSTALPAGSQVRLFAMTDCYIQFGTSLAVEATTESTFFRAGTETITVPAGATHIAALRYAADGGLYISGVQ